MEISVQFTAELPVKITKRKNWVVATCPILDVHSQGKTEKKAKENLKEALSLFFVSCFERGTLDAALKECGFKAVKPQQMPRKERSVVKREDYINIPIPFLVNKGNPVECHGHA